MAIADLFQRWSRAAGSSRHDMSLDTPLEAIGHGDASALLEAVAPHLRVSRVEDLAFRCLPLNGSLGVALFPTAAARAVHGGVVNTAMTNFLAKVDRDRIPGKQTRRYRRLAWSWFCSDARYDSVCFTNLDARSGTAAAS